MRDARVRQTLLDALVHVVGEARAVRRSLLLAATAEDAEQGRVCAGRCRHPDCGSECDNGANENFRDQQVSSPQIQLKKIDRCPGC